MHTITDKTTKPRASNTDFPDTLQEAVASRDIAAMQILMPQAAHRDLIWSSEAGQTLLIGIVSALVETIEAGRMTNAMTAVAAWPKSATSKAREVLVRQFYPDGVMRDPAAFDDASLLCLILLMKGCGRRDAAVALIEQVSPFRPSTLFRQSAPLLKEWLQHEGATYDLKPKLVIWDLDDTLWQGTLAEGDTPVLNETRAGFVRSLNQHGIISAICSKNDFRTAKAALEGFGLWDEFVFPRIAFEPKGVVVKQMIGDMQLRPVNVLFIDDNPQNLSAVAAAAPGVRVIDARSPDCDKELQDIVNAHAHIDKNRIKDYRLLESRLEARTQSGLSDEAFLMQSGIEATHIFRMDNLEFEQRIEELVNRSNQLNYTKSRLKEGELRPIIMNLAQHEIFSAFVWDKFGYYGLVGVAIFNRPSGRLTHFAFSCRIMHMGVEDFLLRALKERVGEVDLSLLQQPLPSQSSAAISYQCFSKPEVRARVLAEEAPRDWSKLRLRVMWDCQSAAIRHYSRFRDEYDFDNVPRVFTMSMMLTGAYRDQRFPEFLAYSPVSDVLFLRMPGGEPITDPVVYEQCVDRFCDLLKAGDHKLLLMLSPEEASDEKYDILKTCTPVEFRQQCRRFNAIWRAAAARHSDRIDSIELGDCVSESEMVVHFHHYVPSALQRIAGMVDDWYERRRG